MSDSEVPILWAGVLIIKDRRVMVLKETDKPVYMLPGGKVEVGETNEQAAVREVMEEIGVQATLTDVFLGITDYSKTTSQLIQFRLFNGSIKNEPDLKNLPGKTEEITWIDSNYGDIEIGNLLKHVLPLLQSKGLIN